MFTKFEDIFAELKSREAKKRMIAAWGVDDHTISAASLAIDLGLVDVTLVGDEAMIAEVCKKENIDINKFTIVHNPVELKAIAQAVAMIKEKQGDFLMKGLCSTDKFLRAVINKETGILAPKAVLSHVAVIENPNYHKLLFVSDMAVIPAPDLKQKTSIMTYMVNTAHAMGIAKPKVALIAATEQMSPGMPACVDAAILAKMADRGQIKGCIADGPLALDVAIDQESVEIKGLVSPVAGDADCLLFPNIESANVFYKTNSKLAAGVKQAGMAVGALVPCVLSSRADSTDTKLNSIAIAAMSVK
ncbi:MAG: phosphate butyryltransferase [Bacteroidales bacterium]|nr:phosphate butyryltransferase [Bacteroidales bacterium]